MKKVLLLLAVVCGLSITSFAQSKKDGKFSLGLELGVPVGNASTAYSAVVGGSLKYDLPIAPSTYFNVSVGYSSFIIKDRYKNFFSSYGAVPLKAGLKYYADRRFFLEGQLGAAFGTASGAGTSFVYSPGVGYTFDGGLEAGVRYEAWSDNGTLGQLALRVAINL
ncbi:MULTISPECIES: outer membrane beta-barrel protein [unclassified Mucilaginibacter]|uniref:outer membrane beta-barrel protein n=1 Tax=unclassified Mucilaginibacter TaxID=2617802 RepID=UPI002AC937D4|nr:MULTISPECIES: outer membrane beta-barrel protein [unclassified Mucilaginibacter]MEB0262399.1 hypothetical protein [Mucilaginibacter sp. 10I4]MEB0277944.1 hypothetical protein [Mucilaginibacter sp. 10B2]MEB0299703.1 hypothetical protein [Mucilaginibacter sp. 5C4]WPX22835.1 hypothetical protein RHM67_16260 [Mucilaginibacter sp. 5C4]